ncbi:hypothetical protein [Dinoroseobacter sp. S76]|uniref:hypothetical protein n=1 Tax=Dinoroseobacter sp. S76 TaxID=3415124 RepID=UPI003C79C893
MAPYSRRQMLQTAAAATVAGPALGAEKEYPDCSNLYVISTWLHPELPAGTPETVAEFSLTGDKNDTDILRKPRLAQYSLRRDSVEKAFYVDGRPSEAGISDATLTYEFAPDATRPDRLVITWPFGTSEEMSERRAALDGTVPATLKIDGGPARDIAVSMRHGRSGIALPNAGTHLMDGSAMELQVAIAEFEMRALFDIRHLSPTIPIAREKATEYATQAVAAGGCKPLCVITSAAVDLLGRPDDCFELTQMRKLRARFPERRDVVDAYIQASNTLLENGEGRALRAAILCFYGLVVWPSALLVAAGFHRSGGLYYLAGFKLLCRLARIDPGLTLPNPQGGPSHQ